MILGGFATEFHRVRASYTPAKREAELSTDLPAALVYRPLSFLVTPIFLLLGFSATGVTVLCFVLAALMPLATWWLGANGALAIAAAALLFHTLDCVDGNIARANSQASRVGRMLDGLCSLVFHAAYPISVGLLAQAAGSGWLREHGLEVGLGASVLMLLRRELEDTMDSDFGQRVRSEPPLPGIGDLIPRAAPAVEHVFAYGLVIAAAIGGWLSPFLAVVAGYEALIFGLWLPRFIGAAAAMARR
jgi:hypothetical protein